jgi:ankyrin repeat protein
LKSSQSKSSGERSKRREEQASSTEALSLDTMASTMAAKRIGVVTAFNREKTAEFCHAAFNGNVSEVVSLFADASVDVNVLDECGQSALMTAAFNGHASVVAKFLECEC